MSEFETSPQFLLPWPWQLRSSPLPLEPWCLKLFFVSGSSLVSFYSISFFFFFLTSLQSWFLCLPTENLTNAPSIGKLSFLVLHSQWVGRANLLPNSQGSGLNTFPLLFKKRALWTYCIINSSWPSPYPNILKLWFIPGLAGQINTSVWRVLSLTENVTLNFCGHRVLNSQQNFLFTSKIVYQVISMLHALFFKDW